MSGAELEEILIKNYKASILAYMAEHPGAFEKAIRLALGKDSPLAWRASWILWSCMNENDERIRPYVGNLVRCLGHVKENRQREWLMILQKMKINEQYEGPLFNTCTNIWEAVGKRPGVRMNAFRMIIKLATKHPDLANEIVFLTEDHYLEGLSPGIRRSVSRMADPYRVKKQF